MRVRSKEAIARYFVDPGTYTTEGGRYMIGGEEKLELPQLVEVPFDHVLVDLGARGYEIIPRESFLDRYEVVSTDEEDAQRDLLGRMAQGLEG